MSVDILKLISIEDTGFNAADRFVAIGAHPDDVEVMTSGLVFEGNQAIEAEAGGYAGVVILTKGKKSTKGNKESVLSGVRVQETKDALGKIGLVSADITVLDIPDSEVVEHYQNAKDQILGIINNLRVNKIITLGSEGGGDSHSDHVKSHEISDEAAQETGATVYALNSNGEGKLVVKISKDMKLKKLEMMAFNFTQWPIRRLLDGEAMPANWFNYGGYIFPRELKDEFEQYTQYFEEETYDVYTYS